MKFVGIDPGVTGALALLSPERIEVIDMPRDMDGVNGAAVREILAHWDPDEVYIERTHAMPNNGSKAAYSLGDSNGALRTAVHIERIPLIWVRPQIWKRHFNLMGGGFTDVERKARSRQRAIEMFPDMPLARIKDHNRAEALLIGRYGHDTSITKAMLGV